MKVRLWEAYIGCSHFADLLFEENIAVFPHHPFIFFFSALGMIPPPKNVKMNSVNFKNILQWESPAFPEENLTFTAQYER